MSDNSRRPPTRDRSDDAPVPVGYLLQERLTAEESSRIAAAIDRARAERVPARFRLRHAAVFLAAAIVAAAFLWIRWLQPTSDRLPDPPVPSMALTPIPEPDAEVPPRGLPPSRHDVPTPVPPPPASVAPRAAAPIAPPVDEPATSVGTSVPLGRRIESPSAAPAVTASLPAPPEERVMELVARRTDDPRKAPIVMKVRYRPVERRAPPQEVRR